MVWQVVLAYGVGLLGWFLAGMWWARYERILAYHQAWEGRGSVNKAIEKASRKQHEMAAQAKKNCQ